MFCPKCRSEYRDGFTQCANCKVLLVMELPSDSKIEFVDFEEVLRTFNPADIAIIKSILDSVELTYFLKGEYFNQARPLVEPVRLMVRKDQAQEARDVLKDLKLTYSGLTVNKDPKEEKDC